MIFLSYILQSHCYFSENYTTDSNSGFIEKYSSFSVPQWKQYQLSMIIIPLVIKEIFQLYFSGEVVCFVINSVMLYLKISRSALNHFIKKRGEGKKMLRLIKTCVTSTLPILNLIFNISSPKKRQGFKCFFLQLLLGHSFSTEVAKSFIGCQKIHKLPEIHYRPES